MITQSELHNRLHYDPQIGIMWWKPKPPTTRANRSWNTRFAGQIAGTRMTVGYGSIMLDRTPYSIHRLAWFYMTGRWPDDQIDHRNGWRLDNAFENLREATVSQNNANRRPSRPGRLKGAYRVGNRWKAQINLKTGWEYLGYYDTEQEAHDAYVRRAKEVFGEFARAA